MRVKLIVSNGIEWNLFGMTMDMVGSRATGLIAGEPIPRKIDTHCLPTHPGLSLPKCRRRKVRTASGAWSE